MAVEVVMELNQGLVGLKDLLGSKADRLLPAANPVVEIKRERYDSLGLAAEDPSYEPRADGALYAISFEDGSQTFVVRHRTVEGNPFASPTLFGDRLVGGGLDARPWVMYTYQWDGQDRISAVEPNGRVTELTGEHGTPEAMLPTLRGSLGYRIDSVTFATIPQTDI